MFFDFFWSALSYLLPSGISFTNMPCWLNYWSGKTGPETEPQKAWFAGVSEVLNSTSIIVISMSWTLQHYFKEHKKGPSWYRCRMVIFIWFFSLFCVYQLGHYCCSGDNITILHVISKHQAMHICGKKFSLITSLAFSLLLC